MAVENASKACKLGVVKNWHFIATLAAAYAENREFEKAKEWEAKAIEMAPDPFFLQQSLPSRIMNPGGGMTATPILRVQEKGIQAMKSSFVILACLLIILAVCGLR